MNAYVCHHDCRRRTVTPIDNHAKAGIDRCRCRARSGCLPSSRAGPTPVEMRAEKTVDQTRRIDTRRVSSVEMTGVDIDASPDRRTHARRLVQAGYPLRSGLTARHENSYWAPLSLLRELTRSDIVDSKGRRPRHDVFHLVLCFCARGPTLRKSAFSERKRNERHFDISTLENSSLHIPSGRALLTERCTM